MYRNALIFLATLLLPAAVSAAAFGFPREPLWVSSTSGTEGTPIVMYAALYNASHTDLKGTVSFLADGKVFDTKEVNLSAGGSSLITDTWTAVKGSHALSAQFNSGSQKDMSQKVTVAITAAPPQPPAEPSVIDKTVSQANDLTRQVAAPDSIVSKTANAIYNETESARQAGITFLTPYATEKKAVPAKPDTDSKTASGTTTPSSFNAGAMADSAIRYAAAAALFAFQTRWLFYILLILLLIWILKKLKSWVNRPRF